MSSVGNEITMSASNLEKGQRVNIKGDTEYGSFGFPNPYFSNFRNAINARHFNRPNIYSENCEGDEYYYSASDSWTDGDPSWRFDCGTFFVTPTDRRHVHSNATTRDGRDTKIHRHGQYDRGTAASYGSTDEWRTSF